VLFAQPAQDEAVGDDALTAARRQATQSLSQLRDAVAQRLEPGHYVATEAGLKPAERYEFPAGREAIVIATAGTLQLFEACKVRQV
jgi:hypothetical protein